MSKVLKTVLKVAAVVATFFIPGVGSLIGKALLTAAVSIGISRLIAKRADTPADAGGTGGGRIQLPPATDNKLPVIYGSAFVGGAITDAMISNDLQTMWYVVSLAEVSDDQGGGGGSYTFDTNKMYYDGKRVIFGTDGEVDALETNDSTGQLDTRCKGFLYIYTFVDGSSSNVNNNHPFTAAQILSTTNGVPAGQAWGANQTMTNCAFAIIKVTYSVDAGTTGIGGLTAHLTNSINKPGDAILDYMLNNRYGCAIPLSSIDTTSLTDLNLYSEEFIDYIPADGDTTPPLPQQARYSINGPLNTADNCLNNLQFLVDSADSWLQYSELTGKWRVVINKLYTGYPSTSGLFLVDSSNLVGGIDVSPIDLNETYNQIEVAYPNKNIKDQTDYQIIDLFTEDPQLLSANEAINRLNITLPLVNNAVQAKYLAQRRLYQSREDLVIAFRTDFSGIQIEAGDVIRITHETYGWTNKLFRVSSVAEEKDTDGNLFAAIQAFEYSDGIYADIVQDYVPAFNTGLKDPNVISPPGTPTVVTQSITSGQIASFDVTSTVPNSGLVLYMDFNFGNNSNVIEHRLYRTIQQSNGAPFAANVSANVNVNDLPAGNYYWSVTARNNTSGKRSNSSALFNWTGPNITPPTIISNGFCNVTSIGNSFTVANTANLVVGMFVEKISGDGQLNLVYPTQISNIVSNTTFTVNYTPLVDFTNGCLDFYIGGINGNQIQPNTIVYTNINNDANPTIKIYGFGGGISSNADIPIDIATAPNIGQPRPYYIDGNTLDANYYYPFYQGTMTTANGYISNSTGQFQPSNGGGIVLDILSPLPDNWYVLNWVPISGSNLWPLTTDENMYLQLTAYFTANQDSIIQLAPFYADNNDFYTIVIDATTGFSTITIPANTTTFVDYETGYDNQENLSNLANGYIAGGYVIRNIVGNTRVYCTYQFIDILKGRD